jgi:hypothetical protein
MQLDKMSKDAQIGSSRAKMSGIKMLPLTSEAPRLLYLCADASLQPQLRGVPGHEELFLE